MTAGEIEGVGEEEVDGRSTVVICHNVLTIFVVTIIIIMPLMSFHHCHVDICFNYLSYYYHHHNVIVVISSSCFGGGREDRGGLFLCPEERPQQEYIQVGRGD